MRKEKKTKSGIESSLPLPLRQFISYLFTGGSATIIDIGVFSLLVMSFDLWYVAALGISFVFGVSTNFFLSRRFVF
ncbi:MAG: GtrA family protein, partial [Prochloron sp. SP5CPC1]|nr:GtrA family protein [Candidatus Paraprochloron terpiosi SP5CPC1]